MLRLISGMNLPVRLSLQHVRISLLAMLFLALLGTSSAFAQAPPPGGGPGGDPPHVPPTIGDFQATQLSATLWKLTGSVAGCDDVEGITVTFTGLARGSTTTNSSGQFYLEVIFAEAAYGWECAEAECPHGETSSAASIWIESI